MTLDPKAFIPRLIAMVETLTKGDKEYPSPGPSGYSPDEFEDQNKRMGISEYMDAVRSRDIQIMKLEASRDADTAIYYAAIAQSNRMEAERDAALARVEALREVLIDLLEYVEEPPDSNCRCHLSAPCNDCVDYGGLRRALKEGYAALASKETP